MLFFDFSSPKVTLRQTKQATQHAYGNPKRLKNPNKNLVAKACLMDWKGNF